MGKKSYISIITVFVLVSIGIGVFSYQFMIKQQKLTRQLEQFEWVIPMGTEYNRFDGNIGDEFFMGNRVGAGTYEEVLFDQNGKIVTTGQNVDLGKELYTYEEDGLQGIKDISGKMVFSPTFESIYNFDGEYGVATINNDDEEVVFNRRGKVIYHPAPNEASLTQVSGSLFSVETHDTCKVFDVESRETVFQSKEYNMVSYIGEGYYSAYSNVNFGDTQYEILLDENFQPAFGGQLFATIGEFSQGYCYVERVDGSIDEENNRKPPTTNGYMDKFGEIKITLERNLYVGKFSEDKAIVHYKDHLLCINLKGEELFQLPVEMGEEGYGFSVFLGGKAVAFSGGKAGLIDETGNWIINPQFDWIRIIGNNLVSVKSGTGTGVIRIGGDTDVN